MSGRHAASYADWAASEDFASTYTRIAPYGGTPATLIHVHAERAFPDPATPDITVQVCTRGSLDCTSDVGGVRFAGHLHRHAFVVSPPDVPILLAGEGRFEFDVVTIDAGIARALLASSGPCSYEALSRLFGLLSRDPRLTSLLDGLWADLDSGRSASLVYAETALAHFLHYLAAAGGARPAHISGGLAPWQVRRVTEALADAEMSELTLRDVAAMVGLSPFHFSRAFKRSLGVPPHQYQLMRRIERARDKLEHGASSVTEIAHDLGYGSSQAFARIFRQHMGMSPTAYRREVRR